MNDDTTQPDDETPSPVSPVAPRRLGYSSRGNASPVGETTAEPSLTLPNPRATDDRLAVARKSYADTERQGVAQAKADATLAKKSANAALEADFRSTGRKFYTDSFGDLKPEVDEAGKPRYSESNWKKAQVDTTDGGKMWALSRRNEAGQTETRAPKLTTSGDVKDPNLYHDFGGLRGEREVAGHVDDLAQNADPETARVATAYRQTRNKAIRAASLKPLNDNLASATGELASVKLKHGEIETQRAKLTEQLSALDSNPAIKQTSGGILGIGSEPTSEAKRLQGQRAALQAQADALGAEATRLTTSTEKGGALYAKHETAKAERDLWVNDSALAGTNDLADQRRAWLKKQGRTEASDLGETGVLGQLLAKQQEFGVKADRIAGTRRTDEQLATAGQTEGASLDLTPDQLTQRAREFSARRNLNEEHVTRLSSALQKGERGPEIQAEMQKADAERRELISEQARITGAQTKLVAKQQAERAQAITSLSDAELMAGVDTLSADLSERQNVFDRFSSDKRVKKETVARVAALRDQAQESHALLDAERKRRGLTETPAERKQSEGVLKSGARGVLAGAANINRMIAGVLATGGDVTGWDWLRDSANEFSEAQKEVGESVGPAIATLHDVDSVASAFKYISGQIGTQAPIFGAAAAAGIMARGVAMIPSVGNAIAGISGAKKAGNALLAAQKAAKFTETAAQLGTGVALQTGSIQSDLLDLAREKFETDLKAGKADGDIHAYRERFVQPLPILTMGLATGLLEGLAFGPMLKAAGLQKKAANGFFDILQTDGIGRRVFKSIMAAEATEIPTELLQTLGERLATKWVDPESKYFTPELADALRETAAATLVSTGPIGALGGIRKPVNDAGIEDAVRAIEQAAAVGTNLREIDQWQQEEARRPSLELLPATRIAEAATLATANPQDPQNAAEVADIRARLDASLTAAGQIEAAPDFVAVDPETNEPINDPTTLGANRDAARALVKVSNGYAVADLTEAETQGLETIGEQLGTEMVRDVSGQPVITDKARSWALDLVPAAAKLIRDTETERLASITAAETAAAEAKAASKGAKKSNEKDQIQKEKGLLNPTSSAAPALTPAAGASVSFTDEAGQTVRQDIPADATVPSSGAPVRDQATAEQYLAETSTTPVRDVEYSAPAKPNAGQAVAPTAGANGQAQPTAPTVKDSLTVAPGAVAPGALLPHLVKRMRAAGADNKAITTAATTLAKNVNDTVARFGGLFGGRVTITDKSSNSGGVAYDSDSDSLIVSTTDLGRDAEALSANPERLEKIVREEAIHRAAVRLEKTGAWKADGLWQTLTPTTRDAFIRAYNRGGDFADFADRIRKSNPKLSENEVQQRAEWAAGHEMVRMLVQGRMSVENGKLTLDGAAISEETASPSLLAKLADILTKIRDYFTDLAGQLEKDGNDPAAVAEVNRVVELVTSKLQALERLAAEPSPATVATNTAETIEGEKIKGEWVKFAPESGTLDVARGEMPQFQNEHLGALTQFLAARGITHTMENVIPGTLKPTQGEYSNKKVQNLIDGAASGRFTPRSILVSSDGYILDRHHQFVAALNTAPETAIPIIRFGATIQELFDAAHDFPSVEYSNSSKGPATGKSETTPAKAPAKTAQSDRAALAQKLGLSEAQIGSTETVVHKGKTVRVVNLVVDVSQVDTSHRPDGTLNPAYPQALQPRDRSTALYRDQQRRIAANPNLAEEFLSGTPDRGTPIMATVDGQSIVLIGNGRANAKALMYAAPDLAATAAQFKTDIAARAAEKGLTPEAVNAIAHPVLVRQILDDLSPAELRAFSQASNEFSGAATNAVEQAKVDASRLTPAALATFNPEFDLDSAKNEDFRREFVRSVIGRSENITGPDLRRRVQAALFAKAFGDTDAGMAAFSRLAGEDDEGTRNLVRSMLDVAPAFAAMRAQITAGNLHDLDLAPALTRAVQEIAVALREKPAAQSADVALDGLVNQTDLALDGARDPLDDTILRFLVANRRNRADLIAGLNAYTAGVYAAGDPKQADMFGAEPPSAAAILRAAVEDPRAAERQIAAAGIGRMLSSSPAAARILVEFDAAVSAIADARAALDDYKARLKAEIAARKAIVDSFREDYAAAMPRFNNAAEELRRRHNIPDAHYRVRDEPKGEKRTVEKLVFGDGLAAAPEFLRGLREIKDMLGATYAINTRAEAVALREDLLKLFGLSLDDRALVSPKLHIEKPIPEQNGYRDDKIRLQFTPGKWAEVIIITPRVFEVKNHGIGHAAYEIRRTVDILNRQGSLPASLREINHRIDAQATADYVTAWAEDSRAWLSSAPATDDQNSVSDTSRASAATMDFLPSGPSTSTSVPLGTSMLKTGVPSSGSDPIKNRAPGGGVNRAAFIAPTTTAQGAQRQPTNITTANISDYAGTVDVSALRGKNGEIWKAFDRAQMDSTGRLVDVRKLISNKNELADPKFVAGLKADPRQTAANAMGWTITGDPRNVKGPRAPLDVFANADGTFTIIDGNATAQAAMLAGWNTLPVNVRPAPAVLSSGPAGDSWTAAKELSPEYRAAWDDFTSEGSSPFDLFPNAVTRYQKQTETEPKATVQKRILDGYLQAMHDAGAITHRRPAIENFGYLWEDEAALTAAIRGSSVNEPASGAGNFIARGPRAALSSGPAGDDLFGGMLETYAQALPTKAKRNKAEAKKLVAKELPALEPAAFDDLFSLAQREPGLTNSTSDRSGESTLNPDENQNRQPDTATAPANGGRAFGSEESNDLGSLFGNPGPATTGSDTGGPSADGNGNVADDPATRRDGVDLRGETAPLGETGERPAGATGSRPLGDAVGSLSGDVPGSPDAGGRRVDARASAESKRLARIARSESLAPDAQNHRILPGDTIVPRGTKTRLTANVAAIKLLKRLETEQRKATPEEKRTLAKYVGWGALSNVFDNVKGQAIADGKLDTLQEEIVAASKRAVYGYSYAARNAENLKAERQALENWDNAWGEGYRALKDLLTAEEWEAARKSTLNAHYTDREVIGAMWRGLAQMGFKGGRVLEPAGGIGHFYGLMPEGMMRASELHGVELDSLSGRIFQALYPDAKIQVDGFQTARLPDNAFDLAVSNVPFAQTGPHDPIHANPKLNLHNYFFAKALDKVRPNGLIAFITTSNTMEAQTEQRAYLAERADFVGAVRLPNNAFAENAGTEVTTDIIFMRKRDGLTVPAWAETWKSKIKVGEDQIPSPRGGEDITVPIAINEYFARHPEMVLGTHSMNGEMYAGPSTTGQYTVKPIEGDPLAPKLETALATLPKAYQESGETAPITIASTNNARNGAFSYNEAGELGIYRNGAWKALAEADPKNYAEGDGAAARRRKAKDFVKLRDVYLAHLALMGKPTATDAAIADGIAKLNELYDNWKSNWNTFADGQHQGLKTDPGFYMVLGLERSENIPNEKTGIAKEITVKADVLKKRTLFPNVAPTKANNALDALRISQSWKGHVDLDYMAELLNQEPDAIKAELIDGGIAFENPRTGQLETKEGYLSGKVRAKLRQAITYAASNPAYQRNVDALAAVQPPPMELGDIDAKLGGGWVPPVLLEKFLASLGLDSKVTYTQVGDTDKWRIAPAPGTKYANANTTVYGAGGFDAITLLEHAIDGKTPIAWNYETGPSGRDKRTTQNEKLTAEAADGIKRLTDAWEKFAKSDAEIEFERDGQTVTQTVADHTLEAFNEQFNGTIPEIHDGSHLTLPGSAPFLLGDPDKGGMRQHQKNGIWRAIQKGETFLAHGVGAGKTRELIAIAMEWKRLGLAQKPLLVVHNPTLTQFANETRKIYPGARMLVATKEDLEAENRRAFAARVASGDWDLIVMAHSSFNRMADNPEVVGKFIADQKAELEAAITAAMIENNEKPTGKKSKNPTIKQMQVQLDVLEERLKKATDESSKDATVYFQDMGIDGILVDEAHFYKKLPFTTKREQIAGLDRSSSDRASNLFMRLNGIREKTGGRNVVLATGTPITNTLAEIWTMIRLTSPKALKEFGVASFDQFANAFTLSEKKWELHIATNKLKLRNRLRSFVNGHGLAALVRSVMDVQMDLELGQPKVRTGKMVPVVSERGPALEAYMGHIKGIYETWERLTGLEKREKSNSAIPAVIYGIVKAATMDMRLIDPKAPDDPGSKVNTAIENVVKFYTQERERKGTQIIFADRYNQAKTDYLDAFTGGSFVAPSDEEASSTDDEDENGNLNETATKAGEFNLYQDIKKKLIARGIPASEIAIAMDYNTEEKRTAMFAKANAGTIRIMIGSTQKLGVGVNVQERLYAMHHLDVPQTPADLKQRVGRGWRSGNKYAEWGIEIENLGYGVKNTSDAGAYGVIEFKSKFSDQALSGKAGARFEDPAGGMGDNAAELKATFSGDPRMLEMVTLESEVRALELQQEAFTSRQDRFRSQLRQDILAEKKTRNAAAVAADQAERLAALQTKGFTEEETADINGRLDIAEKKILSDGIAQPENATMVANKILAPGVTLEVYAKGIVNARPKPNIISIVREGQENGYQNGEDEAKTVYNSFAEAMAARPVDTTPLVSFRASAAIRLDGEAWVDAGITSERAKALPALIAHAASRAQSLGVFRAKELERQITAQADAKLELTRGFEDAGLLAGKQARLKELQEAMAGKVKTPRALADGRGPGGTMRALASGTATFADPNQLEFEQITAEEMASVERVLAESDRAGRVKDGLPLADTIARKFSNIPGTDADDVRQEARIALINAAKSYTAAKGPFKPYAGTAIRNRLRDVFRDAIARLRTEGTSADAPNAYGSTITDNTAGTDDTRTGAETNETARILNEALAKLPPHMREILQARASGESFESIAERQGGSKQAAQQRAANAAKLVRSLLKKAGVKTLEADGVLASGSATAQTDTPEFKAWFGNSKVTDDNGRPLVVYHGTTETRYVDGKSKKGNAKAGATLQGLAEKHGISEASSVASVFERWVSMGMAEQMGITPEDAKEARRLTEAAKGTSEKGKRELAFSAFQMPGGALELGSHFGTADQANGFGETFPFFLSIKNPLRLSDLGTWNYQSVMREARRAGVKISEDEYTTVFNAFDNNAALRKLLLEKGVDGIVYENEAEGSGDSYIAFAPTQIKSADGNSGAFDPTNPSILNSASATDDLAPAPQPPKVDDPAQYETYISRLKAWVAKAPDMLAFKVADGKYFVDLVSKNVRKGEQPWRISTFGYPMGQGGIPLPMGHQDFATKFDAMKMALESRGRMPAPGLLFSSPAEDEADIIALMRELSGDVREGAINRNLADAEREPPGNQTIGNPDLANPAGPDATSRKVMNAVDEARKDTMERETHEQWRTAAVDMIARDRAGVLRDLLSRAQAGEALSSPVQIKAAQLLVNDLIQKATADRSNVQAMRDAQTLAWSYREGGTEQARAMAARRDPFKKPADRYREFLAGAIFTPTPALRKQLASTWSPAEKQRRIASLNKQLADARAQAIGQPTLPAGLQKQIANLNQSLGQALQQKDRAELLNTALDERMKRIDAEFAKMGITLDDVFAGDAYLRLRGQKIDNNVFDAANYSAIKRRALTLIKKGWSNDYIAKKTGLTAPQVDAFYTEHVAQLRERLEKLGDAALDPDKLDALNLASAAARLNSATGALSAAERAARIDEMIAKMGYAKNETREQRTRRAPPARRNPTAKPTTAPKPTAPAATEPGETPAFPTDATGKANPYDFAADDAAPPLFDLSDPVHVAQVARILQAIDAAGFDMATEYWVNAVLSGPLTQGANILGNTANTAWDFTFKRFGEAALNQLTYRDANAPQLGEFKHMLRATQPALARAWGNALRTWTAESPMFENDVLNQQLDLAADFEKGGGTRTAIPGKLGQRVRIPGRLLMATDDFFKSFIATVEASAQGYRIAKNEGLTGAKLESRIAGLVNLPGSAAWIAAVSKAQELTFQEKHEGKPAGRLLQLAGNVREFDVGHGIKPGRFVLPFVRTPFNIFAQGLRQSPAGMAALLVRFGEAGFYKIKNGKPIGETYAHADQVKHLTEQLIAWTAVALLYAAAAGDDDDEDKPVLITGSVPYKDPGTNALNQRAATPAFSIRAGGTIMSYARIEPLATMLGTTIDTIRGTKTGKKDGQGTVGSLMAAASQILPSLANQAAEKTFMRGLGDLIDAAKGERKGDRAQYIANWLASWVPNLVRQPLAKLDPFVRDRSGDFGERLTSAIVPQAAQAKVDVYGEKIKQPGLAAWRALVPITVRQAPDVARVDRLLTNWNQAHPENDYAPLPLTRTIRLNAKTARQLTPAELSDYSIRAGRMAASILRPMALNVEKPTAADLERVKKAFSTARTITRRQMFGATAQEVETP